MKYGIIQFQILKMHQNLSTYGFFQPYQLIRSQHRGVGRHVLMAELKNGWGVRAVRYGIAFFFFHEIVIVAKCQNFAD